ncbi:LysR substrate-binding domain-containing protein [Phenylobacterium sp. J426]|uniref:LysR substrate-binding domain-containing protein n=1 Tax=Phenylobacterium sp. J426 TaxID=2898439 RepID=UPI002150A1EA|nr:LysR substrate-binding domain-containing protein [Phenylobacterium sp. J426]MCR5876452.1 LysR substrate-binding domain-containing protein [Phenylobacterium sp. J426]
MAREGPRPGAGGRSAPARRLLPPFAALRAFEAVGQLGGIRRAAQELGVDHAAVSRHLRALEEWAGVKLIDRDRGGQLTQEGAKYLARISAALEEISRATLDLTHRGDESRLVIWSVPGFAYRWLIRRLPEFNAVHPGFDLEVRPTDHAPDFGRHEADADIRYVRDMAPPHDPDVQSVEIARPSVFPAASPSVAARLGADAPVSALLGETLLHEDDDSEWRAWLAARQVQAPERLGGPRLWHAHLTLDAARRGQGVALTNALLVGDELASGELVQLKLQPDQPEIRFGAYALRVRKDRWRDPAILKFRRWLERAAADDPALD